MLLFALPNRSAKVKLLKTKDALHLVAAFNTSSPPVVWNYDLSKSDNAAISLKEKEGEWDLGLTKADGNFAPVAHFDERNEAEIAYATVRKALLRTPFLPPIGPWLRLGLLVLLAFFFLGFWSPSSLTQLAKTDAPPSAATQVPKEAVTQNEGPKEIINGVPMTADDVLTPPAD